MSTKKINKMVILAGGLGTRLRSVVHDVPKPMAMVGSKPFLDHLISYWIGKGIKTFFLLVSYKNEIIENYFGSRFLNAKIIYCKEETPAGTGGAIKLFLDNSTELKDNDNFIIMNGDTWLNINMKLLLENFNSSEILIAVKSICYNDRYNSLKLEKNFVTEILKPTFNLAIINSGLYVSKKKVIHNFFKNQNERIFSFENIILPELIKNKKLKACFGVKDFLDIGIPSDYRKCLEIINK